MTACEVNVNKTSSILRAAVSETARQDICQGELQTWKELSQEREVCGSWPS